jgi:sporulation protein YlmC with PRC-barrel domain
MKFPLDADVHCTDGLGGRSTYVVLNPATEQITHLVVKEKKTRVQRLVPVLLVGQTAAQAILLNCTLQELAALERFDQTDFVYGDLPHHATDPNLTLLWPYAVPAKRIVDDKIRPIPPGDLAVRRGARVQATDGRVGRVEEFLVEPDSSYITHLCLRDSRKWGDQGVCVPVSEIAEIKEEVVYLKVDRKAVAAMTCIEATRCWE